MSLGCLYPVSLSLLNHCREGVFQALRTILDALLHPGVLTYFVSSWSQFFLSNMDPNRVSVFNTRTNIFVCDPLFMFILCCAFDLQQEVICVFYCMLLTL